MSPRLEQRNHLQVDGATWKDRRRGAQPRMSGGGGRSRSCLGRRNPSHENGHRRSQQPAKPAFQAPMDIHDGWSAAGFAMNLSPVQTQLESCCNFNFNLHAHNCNKHHSNSFQVLSWWFQGKGGKGQEGEPTFFCTFFCFFWVNFFPRTVTPGIQIPRREKQPITNNNSILGQS